MRIALVNPAWTYEGSIYFGCREPHLPLELAYARELLEAEGHEVTLVDAHAEKHEAERKGEDSASSVHGSPLFARRWW